MMRSQAIIAIAALGLAAAVAPPSVDAATAPSTAKCLRPGDRIRIETPQTVVVYSAEARRKQENYSVWGCLKSRGVRVRLDVHRHYRLNVYPPAGRIVAVQTQKECENSIDCIDPWWLTLADLKTGQIYNVDQDYVPPTFLTWARVRPTGSVVFQVSLGSAQSRLVTCEMPHCYNGTRATRRVVLDEGRIKRPSLTGSTVRWRNNGTWRTAQLR